MILFILGVLWVIIASLATYGDYSRKNEELASLKIREKKEDVFQLPNGVIAKINYNVPLTQGTLSQLKAQDYCEKNNSCPQKMDATKYLMDGTIISEIHCTFQESPYLFLRLFYAHLLGKETYDANIVEYTCKMEQKFTDGTTALYATYKGKTSTADIEKISKERVQYDYKQLNEIPIKPFEDEIEITEGSGSYYQNSECREDYPGYSKYEKRCLQDEYIFYRDGKIGYSAYYPNGILRNEQTTFKDSWISKIYDENGGLKTKIIEKGNDRTEEYYSYGKLKQINRTKRNKDLTDLRYTTEIYSPSGELKYEIKRNGRKAQAGYEYVNGKKKEMTKAQIYNNLKIEVEE